MLVNEVLYRLNVGRIRTVEICEFKVREVLAEQIRVGGGGSPPED